MTIAERRSLVMQLASQMPDDKVDAIAVCEWLRQVVIIHWGDEKSNVVSIHCERPDALA